MEAFSLLGGPLYRLGRRLGLASDGANTVVMGLALGWLPWLVLMALALAQGGAATFFSLPVIAAHARLLVAIPLFFVAEIALDAKFRDFVTLLIRTGVAGERALPGLSALAARLLRWKDSWILDAASFVAAVALSAVALRMRLSGDMTREPSAALANLPLAALWYWLVCLPLFRFLMFRWLARLALWWLLLWRVSRMPLDLSPAHPDGAGGLGYLEIVHTRFAPLAFALSAIVSANFAEEIATGRTNLTAAYPALFLTLLISLLLFVAPPCIFVFKLRACQEKGLRDYEALSSRYVAEFDRKWIRGEGPQEPLLGAPDIQSLADLSTSFDLVRKMRLAPIGVRLLASIGVATAAPLLPLLLFDYPLARLAQLLLRKLAGL
jgi:hypothetical protein